VERETPRPPLDRSDELLRVDPIAALRRDAPRRSMGMGQQAEPLELGELDPYGRRGGVDARALDERLRADGLPRGNVFLDDAPEDLALAWGELHLQRW